LENYPIILNRKRGKKNMTIKELYQWALEDELENKQLYINDEEEGKIPFETSHVDIWFDEIIL